LETLQKIFKMHNGNVPSLTHQLLIPVKKSLAVLLFKFQGFFNCNATAKLD